MTNGPDFTKRGGDDDDDPTVVASPTTPLPENGVYDYHSDSDSAYDYGQPGAGPYAAYGLPPVPDAHLYDEPAANAPYGSPWGVAAPGAGPYGFLVYLAYPAPTPARPRMNSLATPAMVLGILAVPLVFLCIGSVLGVIGLILGLISYFQIRSSDGEEIGSNAAITGIVTSVVALVMFALYWVFILH